MTITEFVEIKSDVMRHASKGTVFDNRIESMTAVVSSMRTSLLFLIN